MSSLEASKGDAVRDRRAAMALRMAIRLLLLTLMAILVELVLFSGVRWSWLPKLAVILTILYSVARSSPLLLMLAMLVKLLLSEPGRSEGGIEPGAMVFAALALPMLVISARFSQIVDGVDRTATAILQVSLSLSRVQVFLRIVRALMPAILRGGGLVLAVVVLAAAFYIGLPTESRLTRWFKWSEAHGGSVWPGPDAIVVLIGLFIVLGHLTWRPGLPSQARLYGRTVLIQWTYPFLRTVVLRSLKMRRKYSSKRLAQPAKSDSVTT